MRIRLQGSSHAVRLLSELNRCRLSRLLCDVVLQVGGRSFPAHRAVLACSCTHFHSLFSQGPRSSLSLDFVSATNFEKVLTFIYTGEVFTDLIDVRVLYELAERLGVRELVQACHATFPDLQSSSTGACGSDRDRDLDSEVASAGAMVASVCSSSAASCSSLSSSAVPTPATPSPLSQGRASRLGQPHAAALSLSLSPKAEDAQSHMEYSQVPDSKPSSDAQRSQAVAECPPALPLQLKMEVEEEEVARGCVEERTEKGRNKMEDAQAMVSGTKIVAGASVTLSRVSEPCSFPDSSAQLGGETCAPSSSCGEPLEALQMGAVEGGGGVAAIFEEEEAEESRRAMQAGEQPEGADQWRGLAEEIIELSDEEERYLEEEEDEEDEEDLVFVENGSGNGGGGADAARAAGVEAAACKACGQALPADATAIRAHAETHLTEAGECRVCGAAFPEHAASVTHALSHVGILLFSCDMCQQQFCSQPKLVRHRRQSAAGYSLPTPDQLNSVVQSQGEVQCAVCTKSVAKEFKAVREHLLTHVCVQSLRCAVCQLPQPSLCALLWHALTHLSLPAFSCPVCACGFLERPLLDRHMALHADASVLARGGAGGLDGSANGLEEDYRCFLCPQTFSSAATFHSHLSAVHTGGDPSQSWNAARKRKHDMGLDFSSSCSSSSPLEGGGGSGLGKLNLGFGLGMGLGAQDKMLQGGLPCFPGGLLPNSSDGSGGAAMGLGPKQKWYRCRYCGKRFAHSGEFTYHLRIHTGEKPYQCKVCLRYFRGRSTMICHLKTHSGALMYRCTVCGLYFSTLKLVSSHMELHKDHLPPDFNIEQTFMYNDHSKEPLSNLDVP